jgi:hypothetical protein
VSGLKDRRVRLTSDGIHRGLAGARNFAVSKATGTFIVPLDDDDKIAPRFLEATLLVQEAKSGNAVAYTDYFRWDGADKAEEHRLPDYDFDALVQRDLMPATAMYPKTVWRKVRGYAEGFDHGLEDWDFWLRLGTVGVCGVRVPAPLFYYRIWPDSMRTRMKSDPAKFSAAQAQVLMNNLRVWKGERPMGCCGGGKKTTAPLTGDEKAMLALSGVGVSDLNLARAVGNGHVILRYTGAFESTVTYHPSNISYHVSSKDPLVAVQARDVNKLLSSGRFRIEPVAGGK